MSLVQVFKTSRLNQCCIILSFAIIMSKQRDNNEIFMKITIINNISIGFSFFCLEGQKLSSAHKLLQNLRDVHTIFTLVVLENAAKGPLSRSKSRIQHMHILLLRLLLIALHQKKKILDKTSNI